MPACRPLSAAEGSVYVNFLMDEGEQRIRQAYGDAKYERLKALKRTYDPTNLFRLNQNIRQSEIASGPFDSTLRERTGTNGRAVPHERGST
jgi:Berberine and berberine like